MLTVAPEEPKTISIDALTTASTAGNGVFDILMRSVRAQLDVEYQSGRIKGSEYATVFLGALEAVMTTALTFTLTKHKTAQDILLQEQQIEASKAQVALLEQQKLNAIAEGLNLTAQKAQIEAQAALLVQQRTNMSDDLLTQKANRLRIENEIDLINQKRLTELAQVDGSGVTPDSVLGNQLALYSAQAAGYARDAEQKAAQILTSTWNIRRTTDDTEPANPDNRLDDEHVGIAVAKLLTGVGITLP